MEAKTKSRGHRRAASCYNFHFNELGITTDSPVDQSHTPHLPQRSFAPSFHAQDCKSTAGDKSKDTMVANLFKSDKDEFDFFDYFAKNNQPSLRDSVGETSVIVEELEQGEVDRLKRGLGLKYGVSGARVLRERKNFENDENRPPNSQNSDKYGRLIQVCESPKSEAKKDASNRIMKIQVKYISDLGKIEEDAHEMSLANSRNSLTLKNSAQKTLARIVRCSGSGMKMPHEQSHQENLILEEFSVDEGANKENIMVTSNKHPTKGPTGILIAIPKLSESDIVQSAFEKKGSFALVQAPSEPIKATKHRDESVSQKETSPIPPSKPAHQRSESISVLKSKLQTLYNQHRVQSVSSLVSGKIPSKTHSRQHSLAESKHPSPAPAASGSRGARPQSGTLQNQAKQPTAVTCKPRTVMIPLLGNKSGLTTQQPRPQPVQQSGGKHTYGNGAVTGHQWTSGHSKEEGGIYTQSQSGKLTHRKQPSLSSTPRATLLNVSGVSHLSLGGEPVGKENPEGPTARDKQSQATTAKEAQESSRTYRTTKTVGGQLQKCHSSTDHSEHFFKSSRAATTTTTADDTRMAGEPRFTVSSLFEQKETSQLTQVGFRSKPTLQIETGQETELDAPNSQEIARVAELVELQRECLLALLHRMANLERESLEISVGYSNLQLENTRLHSEISLLESHRQPSGTGLALALKQQRGSCVH